MGTERIDFPHRELPLSLAAGRTDRRSRRPRVKPGFVAGVTDPLNPPALEQFANDFDTPESTPFPLPRQTARHSGHHRGASFRNVSVGQFLRC